MSGCANGLYSFKTWESTGLKRLKVDRHTQSFESDHNRHERKPHKGMRTFCHMWPLGPEGFLPLPSLATPTHTESPWSPHTHRTTTTTTHQAKGCDPFSGTTGSPSSSSHRPTSIGSFFPGLWRRIQKYVEVFLEVATGTTRLFLPSFLFLLPLKKKREFFSFHHLFLTRSLLPHPSFS